MRGAPECYVCRCSQSLGSWLPLRRSRFPVRPCGLPTVTVPRCFRDGFILSYAFVPSRVSRVTTRPVTRATFLGLPCPHRDINQRRPHPRASQARYVPPSAFRTPSTASSATDLAGLFHPAATFRVRSPGVSPREKPHGLVARRCPHVVGAVPLPPVARLLQDLVLASRALLLSRIRRRQRWFRPSPARSPPELFLPRVLLRAP